MCPGSARGGTDIQILCQPCHRTKSGEEQSVGNTFSIQSRFSPHAVKHFKNQAPQAPLVLQHGSPGRGDVWSVDVVKCRANCWKYSSSDWSIFCCLDSIQRCEKELGDWNWISAPTPDTPGKIMKMLPFFVERVVFSGCHGVSLGSWQDYLGQREVCLQFNRSFAT